MTLKQSLAQKKKVGEYAPGQGKGNLQSEWQDQCIKENAGRNEKTYQNDG